MGPLVPASRELAGWQAKRIWLVRDAEVGRYLERLLVVAVVTILVTRGYLQATGFPQIGSGGLHIAHMLWGGLLMLLANVMLLALLGRHVRRVASVVAGIGFGLFIDELGKFITSDNDYFYRPTIALIYVISIVLFLAFRYIERRAPLSDLEQQANASATALDASLGQRRDGEDGGPVGLFTVVRQARDRLVRQHWLHRVVVAAFALEAVLAAIAGVVLFLGVGPIAVAGQIERSFAAIGHLVASSVELLLVVIGVVCLPRSRLRAYHWLRLSVLVSIFCSQGFLFYEQQLGALGGLALDLLMLAVLDAMLAAMPDTAHGSVAHGDSPQVAKRL